MRKFSELGHVYRTEPCQEFPGEWLVYYPNRLVQDENSFATFEEAMAFARTQEGFFPTDPYLSPIYVSICWKCSDNDPRQGEVWFTGFYQHGKFDSFGRYKS